MTQSHPSWREAQWQERRPARHLAANDFDPPRRRRRLAWLAWLAPIVTGLAGYVLGRL